MEAKDRKLVDDYMGVTEGEDVELINKKIEWAEDEAFELSGIAEEHRETFKNNVTYDRLVFLLTTHYYEYRLSIGSLSEGEVPYTIKRASTSLHMKYKRWLFKNGN